MVNALKTLKIAAMGDLHVRSTSKDSYKPIFQEICQTADILVLCGDLTDHGFSREAVVLAQELEVATIPVVGVLGNHDYANDQQEEIEEILSNQGNVIMLGEEPYELHGVGFAGVKGFCGGFDNHLLAFFGERAIKQFVKESVDESLRLENLLNSLETEKKVVALHYSPVAETIEGEPKEIYPFLGSSRLANSIDRYNVTAVFHGHSHHGKAQGKTMGGVPVYNASLHVLQTMTPKQTYVSVEV